MNAPVVGPQQPMKVGTGPDDKSKTTLPRIPAEDKRSVLPAGWLFTTGLKDGLFKGVEIMGNTQNDSNPDLLHNRDRITAVEAGGKTLRFDASFPVAHLNYLDAFINSLPKNTTITFTVERLVPKQNADGTTTLDYQSIPIKVVPQEGSHDLFLRRSDASRRVVPSFDAPLVQNKGDRTTVVNGQKIYDANFNAATVLGAVDNLPYKITHTWLAEGNTRGVVATNGQALRIVAPSQIFSELYGRKGEKLPKFNNNAVAVYQIGEMPVSASQINQTVDTNIAAAILNFLQNASAGDYLPLYILTPHKLSNSMTLEDIGKLSTSARLRKPSVVFLKRSDLLRLGSTEPVK